MDRTRAALPNPAAEFRALEIEHVSKNPQQGHVWRHVDRHRLAVHLE
jgi:hypothetical protein